LGKALELKKIIKAVAVSQIVTVMLIGILGVYVYFGKLTENNARLAVFAVMVVSLIFGAFVLAKNIERAGLINGLVLAMLYFGSFAVMSIAIKGKISIDAYEATRLVTILASGMLGGVLGINTQKGTG